MTAKPRRRSSWTVWIAGAVVLPVLYVASYGPVVALRTYGWFPEGLLSLYDPVWNLAHATGNDHLTDAYWFWCARMLETVLGPPPP